MRIEKYPPAALKEFLDSETYRTMPYVPVSQHRALSWLHNPRLKPEDIIMYLGFEGEDMVAYRCILPDRYGEVRFGWLSGIWVRPDMRGRGLAGRLLEEAYADWGHQLMVTNYTPESRAVFYKSGRFERYLARPGLRYYQRSASARLLGNRRTLYRRSRPLLSLADGLLNAVQEIRILFSRKDLQGIDVEENRELDLESLDFLEKNGSTGFCLRGREDFDWITSYPWVKPGSDRDTRYFFSSIAPVFQNICLKVRDADGNIGASLWLVIHGNQMTTPYVAFSPHARWSTSGKVQPDLSSVVSGVLNHYLQRSRVSYLTTYQPDLTEIFRPGPILGRRSMTQNYFATRDLIRQLPDPRSLSFQDGDGDVVFV